MKKFNIKVNGAAYEVEVEEVKDLIVKWENIVVNDK